MKIGPLVHSRFYNIWDCVLSERMHSSAGNLFKIIFRVSAERVQALPINLRYIYKRVFLKQTAPIYEQWAYNGHSSDPRRHLFICKEFCTFSSEWLSVFQINITTIPTCQPELEEFPGGALHVSQNSLRINKAFSRHDAHSLEVGWRLVVEYHFKVWAEWVQI